MTVSWKDLHPGIAEWVRKKNGEERLYVGRILEMPLEAYIVFRYCENSERAAQSGDDAIERLLQMQERQFALRE